ncbi:hypothetical protein HanRHA438_Chr09g0400791 [Helianthus annuus]|nr:hypothetical protein HanIR_Chr09g0419631 [Helianthus annuus]KAJ0888323.1 hypothetical protein HanRHA438_Chr09g0400791 [Helianthus annuus]
MNWGLEMSVFHFFETDLKRPRDLTGNRRRIASMISGGRLVWAEVDIAGGLDGVEWQLMDI